MMARSVLSAGVAVSSTATRRQRRLRNRTTIRMFRVVSMAPAGLLWLLTLTAALQTSAALRRDSLDNTGRDPPVADRSSPALGGDTVTQKPSKSGVADWGDDGEKHPLAGTERFITILVVYASLLAPLLAAVIVGLVVRKCCCRKRGLAGQQPKDGQELGKSYTKSTTLPVQASLEDGLLGPHKPQLPNFALNFQSESLPEKSTKMNVPLVTILPAERRASTSDNDLTGSDSISTDDDLYEADEDLLVQPTLPVFTAQMIERKFSNAPKYNI